MPSNKSIYILIGQKGSGKSFIGKVLQDLYGISFIRVEDIAKQIKKGRSIGDDSYHKEVFNQIESHLRKVLKSNSHIIFESTGLTTHFDRMLENLKREFNVICIYVDAEPELCLERVRNRDQSIHINVSDEEVEKINSLVREKKFVCEFDIDNNNSKEKLMKALENIFNPGTNKFENN